MKKIHFFPICCVYEIRCLKNDKIYIGGTIDFINRKSNHMSRLKYNKHRSESLQKDYILYGKDFFQYNILEYCNKDNVKLIEQEWINKTNCYNINYGYNTCPTSDGTKQALSTVEKIRISHIGRKLSSESKMKIKKGWTNERKQAVTMRTKGKKRNPEIGKKISSSNRKYEHLVNEWINLKKQGYSYLEIHELYNNIPISTIYNYVNKYNGVKIKNIYKTPRRYIHLIDEFIDLRNKGFSYAEISKKYNIRYATIQNYIKNYAKEREGKY